MKIVVGNPEDQEARKPVNQETRETGPIHFPRSTGLPVYQICFQNSLNTYSLLPNNFHPIPFLPKEKKP